jgi:hypothetical protein
VSSRSGVTWRRRYERGCLLSGCVDVISQVNELHARCTARQLPVQRLIDSNAGLAAAGNCAWPAAAACH